MRFGPWYSLADAYAHAPAGENVLQLRVPQGLIDYPRGKSAMVRYAHASDARTVAVALAAELAPRELWCRHLIELDGEVALDAFAAKLRDEFVRRFGRTPILE
ncbi:MAG: hypothetical protein NT062_23460 [Proteobacteria bacterium]|nr:hypothetical protein [Pseudomonadota bacterium]